MNQPTRLKSAVPVLTALDVAAALSFWVEKMGFSGSLLDKGFAKIQRDEIELFICSVDSQLVPDNTQAWIRVSGLEQLREEWAQKISTNFCDPSGPAITEITQQPWGRDLAVRDVAGNCVHFNER
jgi:hypothetical protein